MDSNGKYFKITTDFFLAVSNGIIYFRIRIASVSNYYASPACLYIIYKYLFFNVETVTP